MLALAQPHLTAGRTLLEQTRMACVLITRVSRGMAENAGLAIILASELGVTDDAIQRALDESAIARLRHEARITSAIEHENIVKVLDNEPGMVLVEFDRWRRTINDKGAIVKGTVKSVDAKGAVVTLDGEVEGYLRASEISRDRVEDAGTHLKVGDSVEALVINIDRKARSIQLSIKAKDNAETAEQMQKMASDSSAASGTTSLGALLKAKFDNKN